MAFTAADVTALEIAIKAKVSGGLIESYTLGDGRNVRSMGLDDMVRLLQIMRADANNASSSSDLYFARLRPR